jgi:hypothetical protein
MRMECCSNKIELELNSRVWGGGADVREVEPPPPIFLHKNSILSLTVKNLYEKKLFRFTVGNSY